MRLKDYGRNVKKRKEYVQQSSLLLVGIDVATPSRMPASAHNPA